jgi:NRAMP (natural resistance-associated macrophage protein)-like metal ion transporter
LDGHFICHDEESMTASEDKPAKQERFFDELGPGLITGCADDDPSGISTYSIAGAAFGYGLLWTALLSLPLMIAVQMMCGRLGLVTGHGLAGMIRRRYPAWVLWGACLLLVTANIINIAADLGGMGQGAQLVSGISAYFWVPLFTAVLIAFLFWSSYRQIARIFKWLTLVLLAYVVAAFFSHVGWREAMAATLLPRIALSREYFALLLGLLGTTISPYLFFWQASQEVEEERAHGKAYPHRHEAMTRELRALRVDVITGMFASNFVMYFIILTTAATLHAHGKADIQSAREAAEALRPLAGPVAYWLFALGLVGTGMLGVPVLAGASSYALAEAAMWRGSFDRKPRQARKFYGVLAVGMVLGCVINFTGLDAVKMLFWSAVINGALAPPLILLVILLTNDRRVMGEHVNPPLMRLFGWATFVLMSATTIGMLFL